MIDRDTLMNVINLGYLAAAVCFIVALKLMNSPITARKGNRVAMFGMAIALVATIFHPDIISPTPTFQSSAVNGVFHDFAAGTPRLWTNLMLIGLMVAIGAVGGIVSGKRIQMTAMPQM